jgi:tryptophanyl-tRNA synthetase
LENRIKRLVDEEDKTRKKIKETQDRCTHIQKNRKRHENDNQKQVDYQELLLEKEEENRKNIREKSNTSQKNK